MKRHKQTISSLISLIVPTLAGYVLVLSFTASVGATANEQAPKLDKIRVVDDSGKPIRYNSDIKQHADGLMKHLITVENGEMEGLGYECKLGTQLQAQPDGDYHIDSIRHDCYLKEEMEFHVQRVKVMEHLNQNLVKALNVDDFGTATHIMTEFSTVALYSNVSYSDAPPEATLDGFNMLATSTVHSVTAEPRDDSSALQKLADALNSLEDLKDVLKAEDDEKSIEISKGAVQTLSSYKRAITGPIAEGLAILYAAKALGVKNGVTFDIEQEKFVMTSLLYEKIVDFQHGNSIKPTGKLDYRTVSELSGTSSAALFYR